MTERARESQDVPGRAIESKEEPGQAKREPGRARDEFCY